MRAVEDELGRIGVFDCITDAIENFFFFEDRIYRIPVIGEKMGGLIFFQRA